MAILALLVRLEGPGQALYPQERIGRRGIAFRMWKFRSMRVGSDEGIHQELAAQWFAGNESMRGYKSLRDGRVTRIGRLLRRTSLDELPQLLNVMRGEMSLVGPRPAIPYELAHYLPWYFERQRVPPGMTGLWQICRRDLLSAEEMMTLDVRYVRECSLLLDLKILALTGPTLLAEWLRARASQPRTG
ncbi:MAG: sugar transferase [Candidatus Dormibacteraeota bacterium]|nr:sugar transferase [Candidatus Dormibacteraeota bacterium]